MLALILAGSITACGEKAEKPSAEASLVTAPADTGEIQRIINASGRVEPAITVNVGSEVSGKIIRIEADFNDEVKAGDILAVIDPQSFATRVEQQRAALENAKATIRVSEASVARAGVNLEQARTEKLRVKSLFDQSAASAARMEAAVKSEGVAEAELRLSQAQLDAARSTLKQAEASLETARLDLGRSTIRSPIDGIVIDRKVDAGQTVAASFSAPELFVIAADLAQVQVEAAIVESDVSDLGPGDPVTFSVDAYPAQIFEGVVKVLRLNSTEAQNIVTYTAEVTAANPDRLLLPGMTASLQITTASRKGILRVPANAELFRPAPEEVTQWQGGAPQTEVSDELPGWAPIEQALSAAGLDASRITSLKTDLLEDTSEIREAINDPEQTFRRTPNVKRLNEQIRLFLERSLAPAEMKSYRQAVASASSQRDADIWVRNGEGKMEKRRVVFGLSDGSFTEVIRGLKAGEAVVLSISDPAAKAEERGGDRNGRGPRR